jgi:hypothetical protein
MRRAMKIYSIFSSHPHRFAFYPSAPVRQAVLRISSRLAPSLITTRSCDRPVKKTRDALNRLLPLKRKRAPAPLAFPTPPQLSLRGPPTETKAPYETIGDPKVSRPSKSLRRTVMYAVLSSALFPRGLETRAWALSSHGAQAIEPLTPLSQSIVRPQRLAELPRRCLLLCLGRTPAFLRVSADRETR